MDTIQVGTETKPQGSLAIFCNGQPYSLIVMPLSDSAECLVQYRLTKLGGQSYTVTVDLDGIAHCECASYHYRKEGACPKGCKHIIALRNAGLLHLCHRADHTQSRRSIADTKRQDYSKHGGPWSQDA